VNRASQAWLSLTPLAPHEIIFILYESKGSPVENERLHKPEPKPLGVREEKIPAARALLLFKAPAIVWAPIQAYCCAEISRAPFGSLWLPSAPEACGRPPCCFGFRSVVG